MFSIISIKLARQGSALCAMEDTKPEIGEKSIEQLMEVVDESIPTPERLVVFS